MGPSSSLAQAQISEASTVGYKIRSESYFFHQHEVDLFLFFFNIVTFSGYK